MAADDLGSNIPGRSAAVKEVVFGVNICSQSEVCEDRVESGGSSEHDVLRLDVSVHDSGLLKLVEGESHTSHEGLNFLFGELGHALVDASVSLAVRKQFQDHVKGVLGLKDCLQTHYVGVVEAPHQLYLVEQNGPVGGV